MTTYNLYIDESGVFRGSERRSVVCGILEDTAGRVDWAKLRDDVGGALPLVPYPFHASCLNQPAYWLALVLLRGNDYADKGSLLMRVFDATRPAVELLGNLSRGERQEQEIEPFLSAIKSGRMPTSKQRENVPGWLRRRLPTALGRVELLCSQMRGELRARYRRALAPYGERLVVVAAVADPRAPPPPAQRAERDTGGDLLRRKPGDPFTSDAAAGVRRDAYVRALETVLERTLCLLRCQQPARLNLWVASRYVDLKSYGALSLGRGSVQEIAHLAARFPRLPLEPGVAPHSAEEVLSDVALDVPRGVVNYDGSAPMGVVVADYVSNQLGHWLRQREVDLGELCDLARERVGLRLEAGPRHPLASSYLPTLAWDGPARTRIEAAFRGGGATTADLAPVANSRQARQWVDFAQEAWELAPE